MKELLVILAAVSLVAGAMVYVERTMGAEARRTLQVQCKKQCEAEGAVRYSYNDHECMCGSDL